MDENCKTNDLSEICSTTKIDQKLLPNQNGFNAKNDSNNDFYQTESNISDAEQEKENKKLNKELFKILGI